MDQQLDQYRENLQSLWNRLKSSMLVNMPLKQKRALGAVLIFAVLTMCVNTIHQFRFTYFTIKSMLLEDQVGSEDLIMLVYSLFQFVLPVLTIVGVVFMLLSRKRGWIYVMCFSLTGVVWMLFSLIFVNQSGLAFIDDSLLDQLDSLLSRSFVTTLFWLCIYLLCVGYLFSEPVRTYYAIGKKDTLWAIGLMIFIVGTESVIGLLFLS